jgi:predicted nucleotidyltransferase
MPNQPVNARQRFEAALDQLLDQIKEDRHILAAILCGSLSHDEVYDNSDIDLVLICTDDKKTKGHDVSLVVDDINIHTSITPRDNFKKRIEGADRNSFAHSVFAKSTLLFTKDPTIESLFGEIQRLGSRDTDFQLMGAGAGAAYGLYKARKWYITRGDLELTSLWLIGAADNLARIEAGLAGEIIGREVIPQGQALNPELFQVIYTDLLNKKKTKKAVGLALDTAEGYLQRKSKRLFKPVFAYLRAEGDARSATAIDHHFNRNHGISNAVGACEYLADIDLIDKVSLPVRLTTRSQLEVDELAFFYDGDH